MNAPTNLTQHAAASSPSAKTSIEELTAKNVHIITGLEAEARRSRTSSDRFADKIAAFCGSMRFVWIHVAWYILWTTSNCLPSLPHFDPFPFTLLTLVVSLEAIFLSTFIMISQTQETKLADRRNNLDLQINLLAEQENTKMLELLEAIARKLGVAKTTDPEVEVLRQAARPETLVEQIERASNTINSVNAAASNSEK